MRTYWREGKDLLRMAAKQLANAANCSLGQMHTNTEVNCIKEQCSLVRIRTSVSDRRREEVTAIGHPMIATMLEYLQNPSYGSDVRHLRRSTKRTASGDG